MLLLILGRMDTYEPILIIWYMAFYSIFSFFICNPSQDSRAPKICDPHIKWKPFVTKIMINCKKGLLYSNEMLWAPWSRQVDYLFAINYSKSNFSYWTRSLLIIQHFTSNLLHARNFEMQLYLLWTTYAGYRDRRSSF